MSIDLLSNILQYETQVRSPAGVTFFLTTNDSKMKVESQGWLDAQVPKGINPAVARVQSGDYIDIAFPLYLDQIRYVVIYLPTAKSFKLFETGFGSGPSGDVGNGRVIYDEMPVTYEGGFVLNSVSENKTKIKKSTL